MEPPEDITRMIADWQRGDKNAESALFAALYSRLHSLALQCLRNERPGQTLGATALVHEAYLRLQRSEPVEIVNRAHFLNLAAHVMHNVIVDQARARRSGKRGGDQYRVPADDLLVQTDEDADQILDVDRALQELAKHSKRQADLVVLRYFAGFNREEASAVLGVSERQLARDWDIARTRLRDWMDGTSAGN
jgi:RNA polymerase sigma factor (TIGR02999 family)